MRLAHSYRHDGRERRGRVYPNRDGLANLGERIKRVKTYPSACKVLMLICIGVCRPSRGGSLLAVQPIDGGLRLAGSGEDRALVALQDLQPGFDVASVIGTGFRRKPEIRA